MALFRKLNFLWSFWFHILLRIVNNFSLFSSSGTDWIFYVAVQQSLFQISFDILRKWAWRHSCGSKKTFSHHKAHSFRKKSCHRKYFSLKYGRHMPANIKNYFFIWSGWDVEYFITFYSENETNNSKEKMMSHITPICRVLNHKKIYEVWDWKYFWRNCE